MTGWLRRGQGGAAAADLGGYFCGITGGRAGGTTGGEGEEEPPPLLLSSAGFASEAVFVSAAVFSAFFGEGVVGRARDCCHTYARLAS